MIINPIGSVTGDPMLCKKITSPETGSSPAHSGRFRSTVTVDLPWVSSSVYCLTFVRPMCVYSQDLCVRRMPHFCEILSEGCVLFTAFSMSAMLQAPIVRMCRWRNTVFI